MRTPWVLVLALAATSCSGNECVEVSADCAALYPATFDDIFQRTLVPTCAAGGSSCHSAAGAQGGLVFADADASYQALLDGRVAPGDPGCSLIVQRLESKEADFQMPPGLPLSPEERCVFVRWIAEGAPR